MAINVDKLPLKELLDLETRVKKAMRDMAGLPFVQVPVAAEGAWAASRSSVSRRWRSTSAWIWAWIADCRAACSAIIRSFSKR